MEEKKKIAENVLSKAEYNLKTHQKLKNETD